MAAAENTRTQISKVPTRSWTSYSVAEGRLAYAKQYFYRQDVRSQTRNLRSKMKDDMGFFFLFDTIFMYIDFL